MTDSSAVVENNAIPLSYSDGGNIIWAQKSFAANAAQGEFEDAADFLDRFEAANPEWASSLGETRARFAASDIAEARLSSIARLRLQAGLSQADLAKRISTSQSHIARIESTNSDPQFSTLVKIATAVDVPIGALVTLMIEEQR